MNPLCLFILVSKFINRPEARSISHFYCMGIFISYRRVLDLEDKIATSVRERCVEDGIVSFACLRKEIHTTGVLYNLNHNPTSTTSQSSFYGTGISLFQFPAKDNLDEDRPPITLPQTGTIIHNLPESYAIVPAVF